MGCSELTAEVIVRFLWSMNLGNSIIKIPLELFVMVQKGSFLYPLVMTKLLRFGRLSLGAAFITCKFFSPLLSLSFFFPGWFIARGLIGCRFVVWLVNSFSISSCIFAQWIGTPSNGIILHKFQFFWVFKVGLYSASKLQAYSSFWIIWKIVTPAACFIDWSYLWNTEVFMILLTGVLKNESVQLPLVPTGYMFVLLTSLGWFGLWILMEGLMKINLLPTRRLCRCFHIIAV